MQWHIYEEQPHAYTVSAVELGAVSCCLSVILILSSGIASSNGTWKVLGAFSGVFKRQREVITKMGMKQWEFLARTAFTPKRLTYTVGLRSEPFLTLS